MIQCRCIKSLTHFSLILSLPTIVLSQVCDPFTSPCHEPTLAIGTNQLVAWETTATVYNISFWQQNLTAASAKSHASVFIPTGNIILNSFNWTVQLYGFELSASNIFFFWMNYGMESGNWTSSYFTIIDQIPSSTSTIPASLPTSTSQTSLSVSTTHTSLPTSATQTSLPANAAQSSLPTNTIHTSLPTNTAQASLNTSTAQPLSGSGGLSTQSKIGLGVGLAVGVSLLVALAINSVLLYRRKRYAAGPQTNELSGLSSNNGWPDRRQGEFMQKMESPTNRQRNWTTELPASHRIELSS